MKKARLKKTVADFLVSVAPGLSEGSMVCYRSYTKQLIDAVGDIPIESLTPKVVKGVFKTRNKLGAVKRLLTWAVKDAQVLAKSPLDGMKLPAGGNRTRVLTRTEKVRILRREKPPLRRLLLAMSESIARPGELRGATWAEIRTAEAPGFMVQDLVDGQAFFLKPRFKGQKKRKDRFASRIIPISRRLGRLLARLWKKGKPLDAAIFRNQRDEPWTSNAVRIGMRSLRKKAGVGINSAGEQVVAYTFRHTGATDAASAGITSLTLAELMGHADVRMTQRYVHLRPEHLIEAMHALESYRRRPARAKKRPGSTRKAEKPSA